VVEAAEAVKSTVSRLLRHRRKQLNRSLVQVLLRKAIWLQADVI